jgi:hypothetical protein
LFRQHRPDVTVMDLLLPGRLTSHPPRSANGIACPTHVVYSASVPAVRTNLGPDNHLAYEANS